MLNEFAVGCCVGLLLVQAVPVHILLLFVEFLAPSVGLLHVVLEFTEPLLLLQEGFLVDLLLQ
jgi:hypothetical protein